MTLTDLPRFRFVTAFAATGLLLAAALLGASDVAAADTDSAGKAKKPRAAHLIQTTRVVRAPHAVTSVALGSLRYRRLVRIHAQEEGRVLEVNGFEGDPTTSGQVLIRLDDILIRAALDKARAERRQAELDAKRVKRLAAKKLASEDEIARTRTALNVARAEEQLQTARLSYTSIKAPFDGLIVSRLVEPGDAIAKHAHLMTTADPASLISEITVSELLLPHLRVGDQARIRIDALGGAVFAANILRIHPEIDRQTRRGVVEIGFVEVPESARAGQFARVTLTTREQDRTVIPFSATRRDRDGEFVFTVSGNDSAKNGASKVKKQLVRTGLRFGEQVEILEGLAPGDTIVLRGFLGLADGKTVKIVTPD